MDDDKKIDQLNTDEYMFDDSEVAVPTTSKEVFPGNSGQPKGIKGFIVRYRQQLKMPLILLGGIITVYLLLGVVGKKHSNIDVQDLPPPSSKQVTISSHANQQLAEQYYAKMQNDLNTLNQQVLTQQQEFATVQTAITTLQNQIEDLTTQLSALTIGVKQLLAESQAAEIRKKQLTKKRNLVRMNYAVQAVVPGRAWLIDENGKICTVKVGDNLTGYGKVKAISTEQGGIVKTSDGSLIQLEVS